MCELKEKENVFRSAVANDQFDVMTSDYFGSRAEAEGARNTSSKWGSKPPEGKGVDSYSAGLQINQQLCPDYKELSLKTMDSAQTMLMPKAT